MWAGSLKMKQDAWLFGGPDANPEWRERPGALETAGFASRGQLKRLGRGARAFFQIFITEGNDSRV